MVHSHDLKGRRVAVLVADGFEEVEYVAPVTALRTQGADIDVISLRRGRIRGVNLHEPASRVAVDRTLREASVADYDALLIPGGFINPDLLRQSAEARAFVRGFDAAGKPIATLCHGPWLLASAGLIGGRRMTSWPGVRDDLVNAGATWLDQDVVRDGNWLTSRGPQDMVPFVRELLAFFGGRPGTAQATAAAGATGRVASSPQRDAPPQVVLGALKWLPRPSLRALAITGGLAALYLGRHHRKGLHRLAA